MISTFFLIVFLILIAIFLPLRQTDLTASVSLQVIRGEGPQLYTLRLASAAISTCEYPRIKFINQKAKSSMSLQPHLNFFNLYNT